MNMMNSSTAERLCFMETCSQVQAASIFLRLHDIPLYVIIQPKRILTRSADGQLHVYNLQMTVDPSTCSSVFYKVNQGISLRFQIHPTKDLHLKNSVKSTCHSHSIFQGWNRSCLCKRCGINLLSDNKRTYNMCGHTLHSEDNNLSDSWTCCDHTPSSNQCKKPLHGADEIYIDEFHFAFPPNAVCRSNLRMVSNELGKNSIQCRRCYSTLGEITKLPHHVVEYCSFYKSSVTLNNFQDLLGSTEHSSTMLKDLLSEEVIRNVKSKEIYKFLICDKRQKPVVLIQVLNIDGSLGHSGLETLKPTSYEELLSAITACSEDTCKIFESFSLNMSRRFYVFEYLSRDKSASRVIKLLYTLASCGEGERLSEIWLSDPNVKILTLPDAACMEVILLLSESTLMMPLRHTMTNGFLPGFLDVAERQQPPSR